MDYLFRYDCVKRLFMNALYRYETVKSFFKELLRRIISVPMPMYVYKVLEIHNFGDDGCEGGITSDDITSEYQKGNLSVERYLSSNDTRVEYRVMWNTKTKYRVVSTETNSIKPNHEMFVGGKRLTSKPKIIRATLINHTYTTYIEGACCGSIEEDVLTRVLKYAGPSQDFFKQDELQMEWMFENDQLTNEMKLNILMSDGKHLSFRTGQLMKL